MQPIIPTQKEQDEFMNGLLADLDESFWNDPTPTTSPVKQKATPRTPCKHKTQTFNTDVDMSALLEGSENWDLDMDTFELSPRKTTGQTIINPARRPRPETVATRCIVQSVVRSEGQLDLTAKLDPGSEIRAIILRDDWARTDIRIGDTINVIGEFSLQSPSSSSVTLSIPITSKSNLLILHPDHLLTATALSNAPQCLRKPLLSALVRSSSDVTPALVWGNILHTVVQSCLTEGRWDEQWIDDQIDTAAREGMGELAKVGFDVEQGKREIKGRAKGLQPFGERYISDKPKSTALLANTRSTKGQAEASLAISQLLDIEEDIWAPKYGLKGKLDATVQTTISEGSSSPFMPSTVTGPKPLEIKTGRAVAGAAMEHRAQTMLYTLLAEERYGVEVESGLLWYTQSEEVIRVPVGRNEIRGLILVRNEMVGWMVRRHEGLRSSKDSESCKSFLPPTIDDERTCKRCYALDTCMLYRKAVENVVDIDSPIADTYALKTSHLTKTQCDFFKSWERLLSLEEQDLTRFRKELWTMTAKDREGRGRCFGNMSLDEGYQRSAIPNAARKHKIHSFEYRFRRSTSTSGASSSLLSGAMSVGDAVMISVEPQLLALARGFITELTPNDIVVGVDHELSIANVRTRLAAFSSFPLQVIWRIDKDELFGGMARVRDNLANMFYADGDSKRLSIVVDLQAPRFQPLPLELRPTVERHLFNLNSNQRQAVDKVLLAEDYALILGMPGTGKTTIIAAIIKSLVEMGKTVLLTSYTHSAVDTILLKLKDEAEFSILRLGNVDKVHPEVQKFTLEARRTPTTLEQLEHQIMTPPVVATTCLSVDHALFSRRKFDYCIIDEASQITLPTSLGPLRFADKFVLVGDHFQLPPLVRNADARKGGLDVSLFRRLSDAHPAAVIDLVYQYRMNADIMLLSNKLIYGDRLKCGSDEVATRSLMIPDPSFLRSIHEQTISCHSSDCWLEKVMSPNCHAIFIDTDLVPARDSRAGDLVQNEVEATLVHQLAEVLLRSGISPEQLGIISLYRQQVKLLTQLLHSHGVEILTADRSQGRDKDCIIISMVRSNDTGAIGDLVKDWRRMNVSFTRARSKLIIFGSRTTLQATPLLTDFFELMESKNWILKLPAKAHLAHSAVFSDASKKRVADNPAPKENFVAGNEKKQKLAKTIDEPALLRGRSILKDLVNATK